MLYLLFRAVMFITSFASILSMIINETCEYIYFPIIMLFWIPYTFLDEESKEYKKSSEHYYKVGSSIKNNYDDSWLFSSRGYTFNRNQDYKQEYKKIVKRCKRTLKVSIAKNLEENEEN